ncbi:PEP-CTERM sorting domain-containing protein [Planctomycetota bacterium]|nr:PEP-CTERM sorting domain-containing protein [Planctomycetota bacterium]
MMQYRAISTFVLTGALSLFTFANASADMVSLDGKLVKTDHKSTTRVYNNWGSYDAMITLGVGDNNQKPKFSIDFEDQANVEVDKAFNAGLVLLSSQANLSSTCTDSFDIVYSIEGQDVAFTVDVDAAADRMTVSVGHGTGRGVVTLDGQDYAVSFAGFDLRKDSTSKRFDCFADMTGDMKHTAADMYLSMTAVPEPASLALFGLGGLALLRRRK